jgi:hypothetical protein
MGIIQGIVARNYVAGKNIPIEKSVAFFSGEAFALN